MSILRENILSFVTKKKKKHKLCSKCVCIRFLHSKFNGKNDFKT